MTIEEILLLLEEYGTEKNYNRIIKNCPEYTGNGTLLGPLRKLAKKIKVNQSLAMELWKTDNDDGKTLACLIFDYSQIDETMALQLISEIKYPPIVNELMPNLAKNDYINNIINKWIESKDNIKGKASFYGLLYKVIHNPPSDKELTKYLEIIERDMKDAPKDKQETMNRVLSEIGGRYDSFTDQCIQIGEKLEVYKDLKVPKGCYSPYAPNWISIIKEQLK